jgi:glycosyltransferase involved in cell wall biosynthesis
VTQPAKPPVSAYLLTFNNARTVRTALRSVAWADEIVVIDSFSTDDTLKILGEFRVKLQQRKWPGFRDQYQFANDQCSQPWRLFIDADEEIAPELAREMQDVLARNSQRPESEQVRGYYGHRRTWYLGRWIRHGGWVPDYEIRLYHRDYGQWKGDLHANVHVSGRVAHLKGFYLHYTYANISDQIRRIDSYSTTASQDMLNNGRRFALLRMLADPPARFVRDYLLKLGFLDGLPGLIVAINTMFHVFNKHAKLWELQHHAAAPVDEQPPAPGK